MIPVSLTIKGLYSYQQETTVDFTNLTAAGLFGIFGAVGSGKSTILEAISFALYGETERLNSRDSRSYNMMNLKSNDLLIDYIFTCGDCDHKYKFSVTTRRNKKKFGDAGSFDRKAYIWENAWIPTSLNAENILGLSYDNFKRTIIIPQGKFQEFLQLKEADRVQMLKEIFGLEKFELSQKVSKLVKDNDLKVSNLQGHMQALPQYDEALLKEKESAINLLENSVNVLIDDLKNKQVEEKSLQDLKALFLDINAKAIALQGLNDKAEKIEALDRQIKEFEKCEKVFKNPFENKNKLQLTIAAQEAETKKLAEKKSAIEAAIKVNSDKIDKLKEHYKNKEVLLQKAAELEKIVSIKSLKEAIKILAARIEKGETAVKQEEDNLQTTKEQLALLKSKIADAEQSLPDTSLLIAINNWFVQRRQLEANIAENTKILSEATSKLSTVKKAIESRLKVLPEEINLPDFPTNLSVIKEEFDQLNKEYNQQLQTLKNEQAHLKFSQKLDEFAKALAEGCACPLCGSNEHPKVFSSTTAAVDAEQKQAAIEELEIKKDLLRNVLLDLSGSYANYETFTAQVKQKQQEYEKHESELDTYNSSFSFAGYTIKNEAVVKKQLADIEAKGEEIKRLRTQRDDKDKEAEETGKKITTYKAGIEKFIKDKAQQEGQLVTLQAQIVLQSLQVEIEKSDAILTANSIALKKQYEQLTKDFEQTDKSLQENNKLLATLIGHLNELQKQFLQNTEQAKEINDEIKALLIAENYDSEQQVAQVLSTTIDIKKEKNTVEIFRQQLHTATIQLEEARAKVEGKKYEENVHLQLQQTIEDLSKEVKEKTEFLISEKDTLRKLREQMQARQELQKDLDKLTLRAENLKILNNLFRSSGFVNYVSSVYLQNLVNAANQRFHKMTRQKLLLELAEDNSFRVRDFMNNGEVRSVKTLSGGQTFQAALSLALALADNIQQLTKSKQNFFFLDEGFGSLDKEALAIVFETLKSLRKENRIVGVISHVDEMQQEIQVNLKIVNDIERGSLVSNSWSQHSH